MKKIQEEYYQLTINACILYNRINLSDKCYDREEYTDTRCEERRRKVQVSVKDLLK